MLVGDVTPGSWDSVLRGLLTLLEGSASRWRGSPFRCVSNVKLPSALPVSVLWMATERQTRWISGTPSALKTALTP
jgi:hypothetical protein